MSPDWSTNTLVDEIISEMSLNDAVILANLSDEDIERYIEFLKVPATRKFNRIVMSGIDAEMSKAVGTLGDNVARALLNKKKSEENAGHPAEG